jgi:hypothetical protein
VSDNLADRLDVEAEIGRNPAQPIWWARIAVKIQGRDVTAAARMLGCSTYQQLLGEIWQILDEAAGEPVSTVRPVENMK